MKVITKVLGELLVCRGMTRRELVFTRAERYARPTALSEMTGKSYRKEWRPAAH